MTTNKLRDFVRRHKDITAAEIEKLAIKAGLKCSRSMAQYHLTRVRKESTPELVSFGPISTDSENKRLRQTITYLLNVILTLTEEGS
jgi:hypothetical protein